jgi:hypothetical protein
MAALALALLAGAARADERMNGMVGLWYGPYNGFSFEYDLIAQFFKSKDWMGNFTGPFLMDEVGSESNRFGGGFATGFRYSERGTYGFTMAFFEQNRWGRFSHADFGAEAKLSLMIFGMKLGLTEDWEKFYWQAGFSY